MEITCTICLNSMLSTDELWGTDCGHVCHATCMRDWLRRSRSCPQCRHHVNHGSIGRIYLNFTNSENTLMESVLESHQRELENLRSLLEQKKLEIEENAAIIANLKDEIKEKDQKDAEQMRVNKRLKKQNEDNQRVLTLATEKCNKLEKHVASLLERLSDECKKSSEMEQLLNISLVVKTEIKAQIDRLDNSLVLKKENERPQNNTVVPITVKKNASENTVVPKTVKKNASKSETKKRTANTNTSVETEPKLVQPKVVPNASESKIKKRATRAPLGTINQNSEPPRYNLRPR